MLATVQSKRRVASEFSGAQLLDGSTISAQWSKKNKNESTYGHCFNKWNPYVKPCGDIRLRDFQAANCP